MTSVNEYGRPLPLIWHTYPRCNPRQRKPKSPVDVKECQQWANEHDPPPDFAQCCGMVAPAMDRPASVDTIALYHFATKSQDDFVAKQQRGSGMSGASKKAEYFEKLRECVFACCACTRHTT
jgi:hypothetical protein